MRRTNFLRSGNFDLVEIIGTDYGDINGVPGVTPWSIQADALSNFKRLLFGLRSNASKGRLLGGGAMVINGNDESVTVSPFLGITKGDQAIWTQKPLTLILPDSSGSPFEIWAKYTFAKVPDSAVYGKKAVQTGSHLYESVQLVADELASGNPDVVVNQILQIGQPTGDCVLIGTVSIGEENLITLNPDKGFPDTDIYGYQLINKISVQDLIAITSQMEDISISNKLQTENGSLSDFLGDVKFREDIDFMAGSQVKVEGSNAYSGTFTFQDNLGATRTLVFKNGLCTSAT